MLYCNLLNIIRAVRHFIVYTSKDLLHKLKIQPKRWYTYVQVQTHKTISVFQRFRSKYFTHFKHTDLILLVYLI